MRLSQLFYGLFWPAVFSVIALIVLITLGNWQMQRKAFKADLVMLVDERIASAPISFEALKKRVSEGADIRYQAVQVAGRFDHENERHYFLPHEGQVGWNIITPLKTSAGDIVFINRGFVPEGFKEKKRRLNGLTNDLVTIKGLARISGKKGFFTPENDVSRNRWFWRDINGLYESLSPVPATKLGFMIDAGKDAKTGDWPLPGVTKVKFSDPHLGYALTWYGLALTLVGVFAVFVVHRIRRRGNG